MSNSPDAAAIAAHRFGLGEANLGPLADDPRGWLLAQLGPPGPQRGEGLASSAQAARQIVEYQRRVRLARQRPAGEAAAMDPQAQRRTEAQFADFFRPLVTADVRARLVTAATSPQPFAERLALFWANHFTVSIAKANTRGLAGAFEREAIRPHAAGRFEDLLQAAVRHPAMLRYLDNELSAGPRSRVVQRQALRPADAPGPRITGLNENLAREVLELHTLGAGDGSRYGGWGGYTQADVTEFARVLTGWRVPLAALQGEGDESPTRFDPAWHDPGPKYVLGRRFDEGPEALGQVLAMLARHPRTARHVSTKLARHVVADDPPPALVARLEQAWVRSEGDLLTLYRALVEAPEAWQPSAAKLRSPEEFVVATARVLGLGPRAFVQPPDGGIGGLGQRVHAAPSPAGWPDRAEEWLGPDAVWKRVEWATRVADRVGRQVDARALAAASLGARLTDDTARQIERAADGPQALALLLLSPEFQRR